MPINSIFYLIFRIGLTANQLKQIEKWKSEHGHFKSIEDILRVKGVTNRTIEKLRTYNESKEKPIEALQHEYLQESPFFSQSYANNERFILYEERSDEHDQPLPSNIFDQHANFGKKENFVDTAQLNDSKPIKLQLEPRISRNKADSVKSLTSIYQDSTCITWAQLTMNVADSWRNGVRITNWKYHKISSDNESICQLSKRIVNIINEMPPSDIYVIESTKGGHFRKTLTGKFISETIQLSQVNAILVTLLQARNPSNQNESNVFIINQTIMARLYNLYVGREIVSTHSIIKTLFPQTRQNIVNSSNKENKERFPIEIDNDIRKGYYDAKNVEQEFLGKSMLIGLTFFRLVLNK